MQGQGVHCTMLGLMCVVYMMLELVVSKGKPWSHLSLRSSSQGAAIFNYGLYTHLPNQKPCSAVNQEWSPYFKSMKKLIKIRLFIKVNIWPSARWKKLPKKTETNFGKNLIRVFTLVHVLPDIVDFQKICDSKMTDSSAPRSQKINIEGHQTLSSSGDGSVPVLQNFIFSITRTGRRREGNNRAITPHQAPIVYIASVVSCFLASVVWLSCISLIIYW